MSEKFTLPKKGFVFWPVGTGDSTTIVVRSDAEKEIHLQIDLRHMEKSEDKDDPAWPIVDELVRLLPKRGKDSRPYLAVFALTHADKDHCLGFKELLKRVDIGELWHTPKLLRDYEEKATLCDDARAFRKEADRRRGKIIENPNNVKSGDRLRIIGHDDILNEDKYKGIPTDRKTVPGKTITVLDDEDVSSIFEAFVHAPFKDDQAKDRNNTSLALHVALKDGGTQATGLFLGDREYPTIKRIFDVTKENKREQYLKWDVLLAAHHCSKKVMYFPNEGSDEDEFRQDIMDHFSAHKKDKGTVVASSYSDFTDKKGDCPPHQVARESYEEIVDSGKFVCTHEHPSSESPEPVKFEFGKTGLVLAPTVGKSETTASNVATAVTAARGSITPHQQQVGFGYV